MNFDDTSLNKKQNQEESADISLKEEDGNEEEVVNYVNVRANEEKEEQTILEDQELRPDLVSESESELKPESASEKEKEETEIGQVEDDYLLKPSVLIEKDLVETEGESKEVEQTEVGIEEDELIRESKKREDANFQSEINSAIKEEVGEAEEVLAPVDLSQIDSDKNIGQVSTDNNISIVKEEKIKQIEEEIKKMEETGNSDTSKNAAVKTNNLSRTLLILGPIFLITCLVISFFLISQKLPNQLEILEISK